MIHLKNLEEIELIKQSSTLTCKALCEVAKILKEGIDTLHIDKVIESFILDNKAKASFKGFMGYRFSSCISVNDAVVHGLPNNNPLKNGDVVSIDIGVLKNGFHGDIAYTFIIGSTSDTIKLLVKRTKQSLYNGIEQVIVGNRTGDISYAVQKATEIEYGYGVVKDLVGHGLGENLHEEPPVPNYGVKGKGAQINEGLVIAIEPMINLGSSEVYTDKDGWTIKTKDNSTSAHFEHNVAALKNGYKILSNFNEIEKEIKKNKNLWNEEI